VGTRSTVRPMTVWTRWPIGRAGKGTGCPIGVGAVGRGVAGAAAGAGGHSGPLTTDCALIVH
jgi:hypothetical protein